MIYRRRCAKEIDKPVASLGSDNSISVYSPPRQEVHLTVQESAAIIKLLMDIGLVSPNFIVSLVGKKIVDLRKEES